MFVRAEGCILAWFIFNTAFQGFAVQYFLAEGKRNGG
jgi:hypothetical protein